jgi:hypothetical protein
MRPSTVLVKQHKIVEIREIAISPFLRKIKLCKFLYGIFDDLESFIDLAEILHEELKKSSTVEADEP